MKHPFKNSLLGSLLVALFGFWLSGCTSDTPAAMPEPPPPEVTVQRPEAREILEWDEYSGRLEAIDFVELRARVSGALKSIHFEDGELVDAGKLLFVIDPRPFQAELEQQKADLLRAEAGLELAEGNFRRAQQLLKDKVIAQQAYDTFANTRREAEVAVEAARARVEKARLEVEDTQVRAPIRGRISANYVSVGNFVSGGSSQGTLLSTLVSLDPIYCTFDLSERDYLKYSRHAAAGEGESAPPVQMQLADEEGFPHRGRLQFIDNRLDPTTATIRARAVFANPDLRLTPGLFARVRLPGSQTYRALLIPDQAINSDQSQKYVLTVGADDLVEYRRVELGPLIDGLRVVRSGISEADRVITSGVLRARPGAPVSPQTAATEPPQKTEAEAPSDVSDVSDPSDLSDLSDVSDASE